MVATEISPDKVKQVANLFCYAKDTNPAYGDSAIGCWVYEDAVLIHNFMACDPHADKHLELLRGYLAKHGISELGFSHCECKQCSVLIVDGDHSPSLVRKLAYDAAMDVVGAPQLKTLLFNRPDIPFIEKYVDFVNRIVRHPHVKCTRMIREGNQRAAVIR